jgi:hypothetical protein
MAPDDPTPQEMVAPTPWFVKLSLIDIDCALYDPVPTTDPDEPASLHVPPDALEESIATVRHFSPEAITLLTDLTETHPLIRTTLNVKTHDGKQKNSELVDCAATLGFVSQDFVRRFSLSTRNFKAKTIVRHANGQRVTSSTASSITFEPARHEFQRTFYV